MKKINLKGLSKILNEKELKNVLGGSGDMYGCIGCVSGTCGSAGWTGDSWMIVCNVSKADAMENFNHWDTPYKWWCCDSCSSTWYCG